MIEKYLKCLGVRNLLLLGANVDAFSNFPLTLSFHPSQCFNKTTTKNFMIKKKTCVFYTMCAV